MEEQLFIGRPVRSLQTMLRTISLRHPNVPRLVPDGIFGEQTLETVMVFQREWRLPVTGVVDNETWDTIVLAYYQFSEYLSSPLRTNGLPARNYQIKPGQVCLYMLTMQAMCLALSTVLDGMEPGNINGIHTGASVRNTVFIQHVGGLPENGVMDLTSWNLLVRLYELFIIRNTNPQFCAQIEQDLYRTPPGQWPDGPLTRGFPWEPY